jgi:1-acyl-sn-glycerol-3-phosphate acyltransferase
MHASTLSVRDTCAGKHLLLLGGTGFLGKVLLRLLCETLPEIGSITVLIRAKNEGESVEERFANDVLGSPLFADCREQPSTTLHIVEGDITQHNLGLADAIADMLRTRCDLIINLAGDVAFNPSFTKSFTTNVAGTQHLLDFAASCQHARLLHTSTCFVVGRQCGMMHEAGPYANWAPTGVAFDVRDEVAQCHTHLASDEPLAIEEWIQSRLTTLGWPNLYTYTKALGEQLVALDRRVDSTIVRPAIVESTLDFPHPGWNEGVNTSAPLAYLTHLGQIAYPAGRGVSLDVVPVDMVAKAMLLIATAQWSGRAAPLYHLATSDTNPLSMDEAVELTGLAKRRFFLRNSETKILPRWMQRYETRAMDWSRYEKRSAPRWNRWTQRLTRITQPLAWLLPTSWLRGLRALHRRSRLINHLFALYRPFIYDHALTFETQSIRALARALTPAERELFGWHPEQIRWQHYWIEVHIAGLEQHVFPHLAAKGRSDAKTPPPARNYSLPPMIRVPIKKSLTQGQHLFYNKMLQMEVLGRENIPHDRNVLVVANHSSHLDAGLVKFALGSYGQEIRALAARDYFFREGVRQFFFENFTNLIPIDRSTNLGESLSPGLKALKNGDVVLMFPEGTRTVTGAMGKFRRGVGYMALEASVDVLPVYIFGTFESMPKGNLLIPMQRRVGAIIGAPITREILRAATHGLSKNDAYRQVAQILEKRMSGLQSQLESGRARRAA